MTKSFVVHHTSCEIKELAYHLKSLDGETKLLDQQQIMDKHQNELRKYLVTTYKGKVKGVMDDETFILLSNQFKRERDQLKKAPQKNLVKLRSPRNFKTFSYILMKEVEDQAEIKFLTWDIVGQFIDWIAVYPEDRSVRPYQQKIEIYYHFIEKIEEIL